MIVRSPILFFVLKTLLYRPGQLDRSGRAVVRVRGDPWFSFLCVIFFGQVDFGQELVAMCLVVAQRSVQLSLVGHGFCLWVTRQGKKMTHMKTLARHRVSLVEQVFQGQIPLPQWSSLLVGQRV